MLKTGDTVICIDSSNVNLTTGAEYVIQYSGPSPISADSLILVEHKGQKFHYFFSKRFIKADSLTNIEKIVYNLC
jgi:hypothetical protein